MIDDESIKEGNVTDLNSTMPPSSGITSSVSSNLTTVLNSDLINQVKSEFISYLTNKNVPQIVSLYQQFWKIIDFSERIRSAIKYFIYEDLFIELKDLWNKLSLKWKYDDEILRLFKIKLEYPWVRLHKAIIIKEQFEDSIDFSQTIKSWFMSFVDKRKYMSFFEWIDFSQEIKISIVQYFEKWEIENALNLYKEVWSWLNISQEIIAYEEKIRFYIQKKLEEKQYWRVGWVRNIFWRLSFSKEIQENCLLLLQKGETWEAIECFNSAWYEDFSFSLESFSLNLPDDIKQRVLILSSVVTIPGEISMNALAKASKLRSIPVEIIENAIDGIKDINILTSLSELLQYALPESLKERLEIFLPFVTRDGVISTQELLRIKDFFRWGGISKDELQHRLNLILPLVTVDNAISLDNLLKFKSILFSSKMSFEEFKMRFSLLTSLITTNNVVSLNELHRLDLIFSPKIPFKDLEQRFSIILPLVKTDDVISLDKIYQAHDILSSSKIENLKLITSNCVVSIDNLLDIEGILLRWDTEILSTIIQEWIIDIDDISAISGIIKYSTSQKVAWLKKLYGTLSKDILFPRRQALSDDKENNYFIEFIEVILTLDKEQSLICQKCYLSLYNIDVFEQYISDILHKRFEKLPYYESVVSVIDSFISSPSPEVRNLSTRLVLWVAKKAKTREEAISLWEQINQIFCKNHLPEFVKKFEVYKILYPDTQETASLYLKNKPSYVQKKIIFHDLLRATKESFNRDYVTYLETLAHCRDAVNAYEKQQSLSWVQKEQLLIFVQSMLSITSARSINVVSPDIDDIEKCINKLRESFHCSVWDSLFDGIEKLYFDGKKIECFLTEIKQARQDIDTRNRSRINSLEFWSQDFAKWVNWSFFPYLRDNGFVSPEHVGAETISAKNKAEVSDATPWDVDWIQCSWESCCTYKTPGELLTHDSVPNNRSDGIVLLMKNDDRFEYTSSFNKPTNYYHKNSPLEMIDTGMLYWDKRVGVRTAIWSSHIDALLVKDNFINSPKFNSLKFIIVKQGFYVPIYDQSWNLLFTPKEFDNIQSTFTWTRILPNSMIEINTNNLSTTYPNLEHQQKILQIKQQIENKIKEFVLETKIILQQNPWELYWAEIIESWSTGRWTNLDTDFDYDFVIKLDYPQLKEEFMNQINQSLMSYFWNMQQLWGEKVRGINPSPGERWTATRFTKVMINNVLVDIDVTFAEKHKLNAFDTHQWIVEKYNSIETNYWSNILEQVRNQIKEAKTLLKKNGCYKKRDGWLWGIWVETRILNNKCTLYDACKSFVDHAYKEEKLVSYTTFVQSYPVFAAGENIMGSYPIENFISENLKSDWYEKMAKVCMDYVNSKP